MASRCFDLDPGFSRDNESCKSKFSKLAFAKNPTGDSAIPRYINRVKDLKERIDSEEVIGVVTVNADPYRNNNDDSHISSVDSDSSSNTQKVMDGEHLLSGDGLKGLLPQSKMHTMWLLR